jgi:hypothetical protein
VSSGAGDGDVGQPGVDVVDRVRYSVLVVARTGIEPLDPRSTTNLPRAADDWWSADAER